MFLVLPPDPPAARLVSIPMMSPEVAAFSFDGRTVVGTTQGRSFAWNVPGASEPGRGTWFVVAPETQGYAVSDDGSVIGGFWTTQGTPWTPNDSSGRTWVGGIPDTVHFPAFETRWGPVYGLSGNGAIAVGASMTGMEVWRPGDPGHVKAQGYREAVLWRRGTGEATTTKILGLGFGSRANAISRDGHVVVGVLPDGDNPGFRWTEGDGAEAIGDLPGGKQDTWPWALSGDGGIIVGQAFSKAGPEAFRWSEAEGMVGLGDLPGGKFFSEARGITSDGTIIVGRGVGGPQGGSPGGDRAFIWDGKRGMRDLHTLLMEQGVPGEGLPKDFANWRLQDAIGVRITSDGHAQIAGTALDARRLRLPYVATLAEKAVE